MFFYFYSLYHYYFREHNFSKKDEITIEPEDSYV